MYNISNNLKNACIKDFKLLNVRLLSSKRNRRGGQQSAVSNVKQLAKVEVSNNASQFVTSMASIESWNNYDLGHLTEEAISEDVHEEHEADNDGIDIGVQEVKLNKSNLIKGNNLNRHKSKSYHRAKVFKTNSVHDHQTVQQLGHELSLPPAFRLFRSDLKSYLHVCINSGMIEKAHGTLVYYRYRHLKNNPIVPSTSSDTMAANRQDMIDVDTYNIMIKAWAKLGKINKVKELFKLMKLSSISPNVQSYACYVLCLTHVSNKHYINEDNMKSLRLEIINDKVDISNILSEGKFNLDDLNKIKKFVKENLKFEIKDVDLDKKYDVELLKEFDFDSFRSSGLNFSLEDLSKWTQDQINQEMGAFVAIENIFKGDDANPISYADHNQLADNNLNVAGGSLSQQPSSANFSPISSITDGEADKEKKDANRKQKIKKIWDRMDIIWRSQLRRSFDRELDLLRYKVSEMNGMNILPYLLSVDANDIVNVLMDEISNLESVSLYFSPPIQFIYRELGHKICENYIVQSKIKYGYFDDSMSIYKKYLEYLSDDKRDMNSRRFWMNHVLLNQMNIKNDIDTMAWSNNVCRAVGKFCFDIVVNNLKIDPLILKDVDKNLHKLISETPSLLSSTPSFSPSASKDPKSLASIIVSKKNDNKQHLVPILYTVYKSTSDRTTEELRPHPAFALLRKSAVTNTITFRRGKLPMLSPPVPWISPKYGGYLLSQTPFFTEYEQTAVNYAMKAKIDPILDALNALSLRPWIVNKEILDVAINVFNNHGNMDLDIPIHASKMPMDKLLTGENAQNKVKNMSRKMIKQKKDAAEMYSLWCTCLYRLSIANYVKDRVFWLPHNLDFRGRVYSVPPHLQHLGGDLSRGLMLFANGKPLGTNGLDWLKIHVINLTGTMKKSSIQDRLDHANQIIDQMIDSANNPLDGNRWWMDPSFDDPWQILAACKEIRNALKTPGGHEKYVSHFPVHQDGSCNGLQHYAALGRDLKGAHSVNLEPSDVPQDVYQVVASLVEERRAKDAETIPLAASLKDAIKRKVVKQTVMTFVYGVTRYGARMQVMKRLREDENIIKDGDKAWHASGYIMGAIFDAIKEMFTATRDIQLWLTSSAILISREMGSPVKWTTPLGLPVIQPYFKKWKSGTNNGNDMSYARTSSKMMSDMMLKPNVMKQKNSFPPNFIHSLDSTHMMTTCLDCERNDIEFVSVHDCYWTHPCSVDAMNRICREQFVKLHKLPILNDLGESFIKNYSKELEELHEKDPELVDQIVKIFNQVPPSGDFNIENVLKSTYFFS